MELASELLAFGLVVVASIASTISEAARGTVRLPAVWYRPFGQLFNGGELSK